MYLKIYNIKTLILLVISLWSFSFAESQEIEVTKLSINTSISSEIAPLVHDSVLYFVSNRKSRVLTSILTQDEEHLYKIYSAPLLQNKKLGKITPFKFEKTIDLTAGPFALSNDGMLQIVTLNKSTSLKEARLSKKDTPNLLGLFEARRISPDKWDEYSQLSFSYNNSSYSFAQPTLSADGQTLIFASDMEGGYGETDLYVSRRTQSGWSEPVNLGAKINSAGSELFPFLHSSGKLYFSSNRYGGQGGFDIYYSTYNDKNKEWSTPIPMPSPINSVYDDFSSYIFPEETAGFFASSREGRDNIYRFEYKIVFCEDPNEVEEENYCFTFFEETTIDADALPIRYQWEFSDGTKSHGIEVDHCLPGPGNYEINLNVIDSITNEQLYNVATYELELRKPQQVYFYLPEKINLGETVKLKAELTGFDNPEKIQYFWDVEDKETIIGETISHIFRKKGIYRIRCEAYWGDNQSLCSYRTLIVD